MDVSHGAIIPAMVPNLLSARIVAVSWLVALACWPLVWLSLAAAQGVGVLVQGGEWIGVAVPYGQHPWGLVNQPHVGFAATRGALYGYWAPPILAGLLLGLIPVLLFSSGRGWASELIVIQISSGACVLGLGWAPALGVLDGPAAGLSRFWGIPPEVTPLAAALLGALAIQVSIARLGGFLWQTPAGPTRARRLLTVLLHLWVPALGWLLAAALLGWKLPPRAVGTMSLVLLGGLAAAWFWVPRTPLSSRQAPGWGTFLLLTLAAVAAAGNVGWAGRAVEGQPQALLWGEPTATNNIRAAMTELRIRQRPALGEPRAR